MAKQTNNGQTGHKATGDSKSTAVPASNATASSNNGDAKTGESSSN